MTEERGDAARFERRAREEAEAAAREAGRIGGPGSKAADEEDQPLAEAGGGVAEGFEQAEQDLIEHASHGEPAPDPTEHAFEPELDQEETVERASRDHERSSQRRDERQTG